MNSYDSRVRYTRMVIEESFLELLRKKPVARITVTELCQTANINRATFYKHYLDINDLMEKIEENIFQRIRDSFDAEELKLRDFLVKMMEYTRENSNRIMALGGDNGDPELMTKTFLVCYERAYPMMSRNLRNLTEWESRFLYEYMAQGAGGVLRAWVAGGMNEPPEEVAQFILNLSSIVANGTRNPAWRELYQE